LSFSSIFHHLRKSREEETAIISLHHILVITTSQVR